MALAVLQAAQQLALLSPSFEQPITSGQTVTVSWKSPYKFTNVEVLQGPDSNGAYQSDILAANATQDMNTLSWTAESAPGYDFSIPFLFRLQKGDLPNDCVLCTTTASAFQVVDTNAAEPDASSPQATSAETAEMMPSATTPIAGATTAATDATSSPSTGSATESAMQTASSTEEATSATSASKMMAMPTESSTDTAAAIAAGATTPASQTSMALSTPAAASSTPTAMSSATAASATSVPTSPTAFQQITEENYKAPSKETLALGLGIGIPLGLLAIGMIVFLLWDKKRKQRKYASSEIEYDEQQPGEAVGDHVNCVEGKEKMVEVWMRESRGGEWTSKDSHKSDESHHERFDFEEDGRVRESWLEEAVRAGRDTWV